jgi:hypothetical protein
VSVITEAKQRSQRSVIGWVTKIYYLKLLRASEGTLSRWSRLHLQLAPTPVSRRVDVRPVVKIIDESLSQHVVPSQLSVGKGYEEEDLVLLPKIVTQK